MVIAFSFKIFNINYDRAVLSLHPPLTFKNMETKINATDLLPIPTPGHLLVKPHVQESIGSFVAEGQNGGLKMGKVLNMGPCVCYSKKMELGMCQAPVKVGAFVFYESYRMPNVAEGIEYEIISEQDVKGYVWAESFNEKDSLQTADLI